MSEVSRIIGDCLEVNGEITQTMYESKLPKFISRLKAKYYRNKLIKSVQKIANGNIPLTKDNILELALYLYNNYKPYGEYKNVSYVKYLNNTDSYVMRLNIRDDSFAIFTVPNSPKEVMFNIRAKNNNDVTYDLMLHEMVTDNYDARPFILDINQELFKVITQYITDVITTFEEMK